jgi:hypothetical protein
MLATRVLNLREIEERSRSNTLCLADLAAKTSGIILWLLTPDPQNIPMFWTTR